MSETSATNGPQETVSKKTRVSVSLLKEGMDRVHKNVMDVNPQFVDDLLLETLLTTKVENLHAVSHLKHETFTVLTYAQDFGTICKESLKRTSTREYYTHDESYYPVPQSATPLSANSYDDTFAKCGHNTRCGKTDQRVARELESSTPTERGGARPFLLVLLGAKVYIRDMAAAVAMAIRFA